MVIHLPHFDFNFNQYSLKVQGVRMQEGQAKSPFSLIAQKLQMIDSSTSQ